MGRHFEVRKVAMEKTAAVKSKIYSRYGREIYMAAKSGVPDPELNDTLKRIIEKAKKDQVSSDVIKRAIDKAKGNSAESYSSVKYEAYGPGNVAMIIDCLTDNVNRTITEVRMRVQKCGGKMGVSGSVIHNFENSSIFSFKGYTEDQVFDVLLDNGVDVDEVETTEDGVTVYGKHVDYSAIRKALVKLGDISFDVDEITYIPTVEIDIVADDQGKLTRLIGLLDELDDVNEVFHNAKLPVEELE